MQEFSKKYATNESSSKNFTNALENLKNQEKDKRAVKSHVSVVGDDKLLKANRKQKKEITVDTNVDLDYTGN